MRPSNAFNKNIDFKVFDKDNLANEHNLKLISSRLYTLASDDTITTLTDVLYFNREDGKLYTNYELGVYSDPYDYQYSRINNYSFVIEEERNTNESAAKTIAYIRVVGNTVTISNVIEEAGQYTIRIIAEDSYFDNGVDIKYSRYAEFDLYISDGSETNPYQIRDIDGLIKMWRRNITLNKDLSSTQVYYYKLMNNLNVNNNNFNDYLLNEYNIFRGGFDGNYHTINGLTISNTESKSEINIGLFPVVDNGKNGEDPVVSEIKNLTLSNIRINGNVYTQSKFAYNIGGLVGKMIDANLTNVWVRGTINLNTNEEITEENADTIVNIGGVVGQAIGGKIVQDDIEDHTSTLNSNVAILYKGLPAATAEQGVHNLGGLVGLVKEDIEINGVTVIPNILSAQKDGQNISKANIGGLIGQLSDVNEDVLIKNVVVAPNLKGYDNIGGVVGVTNNVSTGSFINIHYTTIEFQYSETLKNSIMGYDKIGGFVGNHNSGTINFNNSYVRNFYTGAVNTETYDSEKFNGNIILLSSADVTEASVGGFVGTSISTINLYTSYFMGIIQNYATTNNVAGIVGDNQGVLTLENSYVDGYIYGTSFPLAIVGGLTAGSPTLVDTGDSTTTTEIENNLEIDDNGTPDDVSDDGWVVGSYYRVNSTTIENNTYNQYTLNTTNVTLKKFYSRLNNNYFTFVDNSTSQYIVKEQNATIIVKSSLTFAALAKVGVFKLKTIH